MFAKGHYGASRINTSWAKPDFSTWCMLLQKILILFAIIICRQLEAQSSGNTKLSTTCKCGQQLTWCMLPMG